MILAMFNPLRGPICKMELKEYQDLIEHVGTGIAPGEDWMPTVILEDQNGLLTVVALVGDFMMNDEHKDICAEAITKLISGSEELPTKLVSGSEKLPGHCVAACFISTAWCSQQTNEADELRRAGFPFVPPSRSQNRKEVVLCIHLTKNGEQSVMLGEIERSTTHPRIIKWDVMNDNGSSEGRFADAMKEGFKLQKGGNNETGCNIKQDRKAPDRVFRRGNL